MLFLSISLVTLRRTTKSHRINKITKATGQGRTTEREREKGEGPCAHGIRIIDDRRRCTAPAAGQTTRYPQNCRCYQEQRQWKQNADPNSHAQICPLDIEYINSRKMIPIRTVLYGRLLAATTEIRLFSTRVYLVRLKRQQFRLLYIPVATVLHPVFLASDPSRAPRAMTYPHEE